MGSQMARQRNGINIGLKKVIVVVSGVPELVWRWQDQTTLGYQNWARDEPSQESDHGCAQQINSGGSRNNDYGKWRAVLCNAKPAVAVCKKAIRPSFPFGVSQNLTREGEAQGD